MNVWFCFLVLGFASFVFSSDEDLLPEPCGMHDIECLSRSTERFLEKTSNGIPKYNIKPIDPLIISGPVTDVVDENMGLVFQFTNLNVTGLRNQKISDFQMDTNAKSVLLKTKADLNIIADIAIELGGKTFSGVYHATASILGTARYNYELTKDDKGVEYFVVGPETLTCEAIEEPVVSLNKELLEVLSKDSSATGYAPAYNANKVNYRKQTICKIAQLAYVDVVHNIRAAAKILSKSAFFKDI